MDIHSPYTSEIQEQPRQCPRTGHRCHDNVSNQKILSCMRWVCTLDNHSKEHHAAQGRHTKELRLQSGVRSIVQKVAYATFAETSSQTLSQTTYNQVQGRPMGRSPLSQKETGSQVGHSVANTQPLLHRNTSETKEGSGDQNKPKCLALVPTC